MGGATIYRRVSCTMKEDEQKEAAEQQECNAKKQHEEEKVEEARVWREEGNSRRAADHGANEHFDKDACSLPQQSRNASEENTTAFRRGRSECVEEVSLLADQKIQGNGNCG